MKLNLAEALARGVETVDVAFSRYPAQLIDWSKQDTVLAKELGVHAVAVNQRRNYGGFPKADRHHKMTLPSVREKCANLDWTRSNADLARELGVSRQRVHQIRRSLGQPSYRTLRAAATVETSQPPA